MGKLSWGRADNLRCQSTAVRFIPLRKMSFWIGMLKKGKTVSMGWSRGAETSCSGSLQLGAKCLFLNACMHTVHLLVFVRKPAQDSMAHAQSLPAFVKRELATAGCHSLLPLTDPTRKGQRLPRGLPASAAAFLQWPGTAACKQCWEQGKYWLNLPGRAL